MRKRINSLRAEKIGMQARACMDDIEIDIFNAPFQCIFILYQSESVSNRHYTHFTSSGMTGFIAFIALESDRE